MWFWYRVDEHTWDLPPLNTNIKLWKLLRRSKVWHHSGRDTTQPLNRFADCVTLLVQTWLALSTKQTFLMVTPLSAILLHFEMRSLASGVWGDLPDSQESNWDIPQDARCFSNDTCSCRVGNWVVIFLANKLWFLID